MKTCSTCGEAKNVKEFPKRARSRDGLAHWCKLCKREYDNTYYKDNPHRRGYIRGNSDARIADVREWVMEYLLAHPCIDCGESDPVVLEFDHREDKVHNVSKLIKNGNVDTVSLEVKKCDVRCANCHRRKTASDFGFWKLGN